MSCQTWGHESVRDPERCRKCGGDRRPFRVPLLQKARGTQQSILGYRIEQRCLVCDGPPPPADGSATLDRETPGPQ